MKLQIVGGGKMGEALLGGIIGRRWCPADQIVVVEVDSHRQRQLADSHPGISVSDSVVPDTDAVVAVKPQYVAEVSTALGEGGTERILSIAAGVTTAAIESAAPGAAVVRAMPNTPALVGEGASAISPGRQAGAGDMDWAESILGSVGLVVRVEESELDAVTGVSGSGPAYVFHLAEALTAAGVAQGLTPDVADRLTRQTLLGAATLLHESGEDPALLRENVTSPGGTTAAGLAVFAEADLMGIVDRVVAAAVARSRELGA